MILIKLAFNRIGAIGLVSSPTHLPMVTVAQRLKDLKISLPQAPKPVAAYVPAVRAGHLVFVSGQIPMLDGKLLAFGPVPSVVSVVQAQQAARQCVLNGLAVLEQVVAVDLESVRHIVRLGVFVCSDAGFTEQPKVANGASELLVDIFGDRGKHARAAVGSIALPLGATVEVDMVVDVS
jgi:enamine deaminase RidA (YjgF/YER057c/UK114 family)